MSHMARIHPDLRSCFVLGMADFEARVSVSAIYDMRATKEQRQVWLAGWRAAADEAREECAPTGFG
jgi:hypothetical protein